MPPSPIGNAQMSLSQERNRSFESVLLPVRRLSPLRNRTRWQAVGLFLLIMPLMVSAVIRVFGWIVILGRKGLLNQALLAVGLESVKLLYSETAVVIGLVNIFVPFMVLPIMASSERIRRALRRPRRTSEPAAST